MRILERTVDRKKLESQSVKSNINSLKLFILKKRAMRRFLLLFIMLNVVFQLSAQKYYYFSKRNGEIIKTDGTSVTVDNLTLMNWKWSAGSVEAGYGTSKLKAKEIEIDLNNVRSIEFSKESDGTNFIYFYANITLKSGESGKYLMQKVYNNGHNNPNYSFVGKNAFGTIEFKIWDVKKVTYR